MPTPNQLRRALDEFSGQVLTDDVAARIFAACDDYSLEQESKPDASVIERLRAAFCNDADAVRFMLDLARVAHLWDDLIDGDKPVTKRQIHDGFCTAVIGLNSNPFFRRHAGRMVPVLQVGVLNWMASNDLEADGRPEALEVAHVIRCSVGDVALLMAELIAGRDHAAKHAAGLRMLVQQDSLTSYLRDFEDAHAHP